jgi:hypothetical protein
MRGLVVAAHLGHPIGQVCGSRCSTMQPLRNEEEGPCGDDHDDDQPAASHGR